MAAIRVKMTPKQIIIARRSEMGLRHLLDIRSFKPSNFCSQLLFPSGKLLEIHHKLSKFSPLRGFDREYRGLLDSLEQCRKSSKSSKIENPDTLPEEHF